MDASPRQRVAIIGSGIAGLTTAYLLARAGHHVEIFEREPEIGMDAHGVYGLSSTHPEARVDVPLRVFSRTYYPSLVSLYQLLGVEIVDADYSFSCSRFTRGKTNTGSVGNKEEGEEEDEPLFGYNRYGPLVLPQLGAYWQLPSWLRNKAAANQPTRAWRDTNLGLMLQLLRLLLRCNAYLDAGGGMVGLSNVSLGDFLASKGYSPKFCAELFYPMLSVVCTCTYEAVAAYPAGVALGYFAAHGVMNPPWRKTCQCRVVGGVRKVARLLAAEAAKVHLNARVVGVRHNHCDASNAGATAAASAGPNEASSNAVKTTAAKPEVVTVDTLGVESSEAFDHVVVATQAHQALKLLRQPPTKLAHALGSFKYERSRVVVHRDPRLMPSSKHSWSPLNILVAPVNDTQEPTRPDSEASNAGEPTAETKVEALTSEHSKQFNNSNNINHKSRNAAWSPSTADLSQQMPMCTVWMQCIDTRVDPDVLQTWNPLVEPDVAATGPVMADASFERPVVTVASAQGMRSLAQEQGAGGVWFVGAYARLSVPLLENGVCAAVSVAKGIGASCPWNPNALPPAEEEAELANNSKARRSGGRAVGGSLLVLKCGVLGAAAAAVVLVVARTAAQKSR